MALTAEQIELRKTGISASEIAAVVGLSPWAGPGDIWADKLGMREPLAETEDMERGNELESALIHWTGRRLGVNVVENKKTFRSQKHALALATPDGFVVSTDHSHGATIEVKAPGRTADHWQDPKEVSDGCPKYFLVQAMWQAGVLEVPEAIVSGLIYGKLWTYRIPFSETLFAALLERATNFWRYVEAKESPPFLAGQGVSVKWIADAYRSQSQTDLVEPPADKIEDLTHAAETFLSAQDKKKVADLDLEAAKGFICSVIKDHAGLALPGFRTTWKQDRPSRKIDWEAIAKQAMDALAGIVSIEELDRWITGNTSMKPGARKFLLKQEK
jgi:putative phage-type endonuclease